MGESDIGGKARPTYWRLARHLHWWTVAFLAVQIPVGLCMVRYGRATQFAEPTGVLYAGHKLIGLAILLLAAGRLAYRLLHGAPPAEPSLAPWQRVLSQSTHWTMYAMLFVVPAWLAGDFLLRTLQAVRAGAAGPGRRERGTG